jgi:hypothetical protein
MIQKESADDCSKSFEPPQYGLSCFEQSAVGHMTYDLRDAH